MDQSPSMPVPSTQGLPGVGSLLRSSWAVFKQIWVRHAQIILLVFLATAVLLGISVAPLIFAFSSSNTTLLAISVPVAIIGLAFAIAISMISQISIIKLIQQQSGRIKELISFSKPLIWKFLGLQALIGLIIFTPLIPVTIAFVAGSTSPYVLAPLGVIGATVSIFLSIHFMFSSYVLVLEGTGGTAALKRSRFYVRAKFWGIVGRQLALVIIVILVTIPFSLFNDNTVITFFLQLLQVFVITPIVAAYSFKLYQGAKASS